MEERRMLWASMDKGNGKIEIRPMQGEAIVLHGSEEAKIFCEFVMSHYQKYSTGKRRGTRRDGGASRKGKENDAQRDQRNGKRTRQGVD